MILLMGAPGSGKGTQGDRLCREHGFIRFSTGDALRNQVKEATELGRKIESVMESGQLVSDVILAQVVKAELENNDGKPLLLDGYPRTKRQADDLEALSEGSVSAVLYFHVPEEHLAERICGRRVCNNCGATFHVSFQAPKTSGVCDICGGELIQRADDTAEKLAIRYRVYQEETSPVLEFYRGKGKLQTIDGSQSLEKVAAAVEDILQRVTGGVRG